MSLYLLSQQVGPSSPIQGAAIAVAAGLMNGLFAVPMKRNHEWNWENTWLPFSILSLVLFPWIEVALGLPRLSATIQTLPTSSIVTALAWGIAVYSGSLLFGISINKIGIALAFSLLVGTMSIVGTVISLLAFHREALSGPALIWLSFAGIFFLLAVLVNLRAGIEREKQCVGDRVSRIDAQLGMIFAITGGALSGLLSLGLELSWAVQIRNVVKLKGLATDLSANNFLLALVLSGGAIPNILYCVWLLIRNRSFRSYSSKPVGKNWLIVVIMAALYSTSVLLWGVSVSPSLLGWLGPSLGWSLFVGSMVVASNAAGLATGEWRDAPNARRWIYCGFALMFAALCFETVGNLRVTTH